MWLESMNSTSPGDHSESTALSTRCNGARMSSTASPAVAARGSGSITVMRVAWPASATARARKRVECPEPTSTIRRGADRATIV